MMMQVAPPPTLAHGRAANVAASRCESARLDHQREVRRLAQLRSADHAFRESLVQNYRDRMLCVARRMLRSEEDAADAVQDAFVSALASLHRFRADAHIATWLHRIVVNHCLMKLRARTRRVVVSLDAPADVGDGARCPAASSIDDVAARIDRDEMRLAVRRSIQRLPEDFREILILRDIDEFDTDQTAALLGLSRAATKTRLHRARRALRVALEQSGFGNR